MDDRKKAIVKLWQDSAHGVPMGDIARAYDAGASAECARVKELANLAVSYAKDADWSRVDAVLGLIDRPNF